MHGIRIDSMESASAPMNRTEQCAAQRCDASVSRHGS
jgi:hypothetical protein